MPLHPQYLSELLESEENGAGVQCTSCSVHPGILCCTDYFGFSLVQKLWVIKPHFLTLPPDPDLGWQCFIKSSLLEQGFVMHLGHNGRCHPVQRNTWDDVSMAGADEEEEQVEDLPEDVSGITGIQDTLVIAHSNGVFHHCIQWCACLGSPPPSHPTIQAWSILSQCHPPQELFNF